MSAAGEAKPSRGRPRARGAAEARRARPCARSEPDTQTSLPSSMTNEGEPKGAAPRDSDEADTRLLALPQCCKEAER